MIFRITHLDAAGQRRRFIKAFQSASAAAAWAELCFGPPAYLSTMCLRSPA